MIRKLAPEVVNQIAAGEVVERPASIVKELVENSLDAGATRLLIEIRGGGADEIVVVDDGDGFDAADLPLAFASHATSKLADVTDLEHIASLGFRGEALASIGAVSRARIQSRRRGAGDGWQVTCDGGVETAPQPCACPVGTRIAVRDLFFNVPARRRFLKVAHAERARIQQLVAELSLARLDVDVTLIADGRELLRLPRSADLAERVQRCFGAELSNGLVAVARTFPGLSVSGVVGEPELARRDGRLELMFVNGRLARESSALHAVRQAYREYLMGGRFPVYVLHVALPPDQVDVNIHPRKAEVRFVAARKVAGCLFETVRAALLGRTLGAATESAVEPASAVGPTGGRGSSPGTAAEPSGSAPPPRPRTGFPQSLPSLFAGVRESMASAVPPVVVREPAGGPTRGPERPNPFARASGRFLQIMDLYLLLESADGLLVVDQHALHERVVYERLRRQHAARAVHVQRLLVPAVVEVTPAELAWLEAVRDDLATEGLEIAVFGPQAVAVHGVPTVLGRVDPARLVRALAMGEFDEGRAAVREHIAERFHSMACRASVMSGDRLGDAEITALLSEAATLEHPHNCPHGRPTVLTFTSAELERYFRRRC